jgi:polynucleotide 5'-hydroxyl-kinase GRC3/NOL9
MNPVPEAWEGLRSALCEAGRGTIYVAGGVDRGKTFLCRYLVEHLRGTVLTAYLDCDTGQSSIGPPGTLGCALYGGLTEKYLRFVGSASPVGHLLPLLTGAKRLQDRARERGAAFVVIDSPGYIEDRVAREFQIHLIDLLQPDRLVAIQRGQELEEVLEPFAGHPAMQIYRLSPAPGVRNRSQSERYRYREKLLAEYFAEATDRSVPLDRIGIYGRVPAGANREDWQGRLVAFCDAGQFVLALGVVQDIDAAANSIRVRVPAFEERRASAIQIGSMKVTFAGRGENGG